MEKYIKKKKFSVFAVPFAAGILGLSTKVYPEVSWFLTLCNNIFLPFGDDVSQWFGHLSLIPTAALHGNIKVKYLGQTCKTLLVLPYTFSEISFEICQMFLALNSTDLAIPQVAALICAEHKDIIGVQRRWAWRHLSGTRVELIRSMDVKQSYWRLRMGGAFSGTSFLVFNHNNKWVSMHCEKYVISGSFLHL